MNGGIRAIFNLQSSIGNLQFHFAVQDLLNDSNASPFAKPWSATSSLPGWTCIGTSPKTSIHDDPMAKGELHELAGKSEVRRLHFNFHQRIRLSWRHFAPTVAGSAGQVFVHPSYLCH
jgi:hypothetical protein